MMLDTDVRSMPNNGASRLENIRVDGRLARSRLGYSTLNGAPFDAKRVIDIFDRQFADGSGETIRCVRDATQRSSSGAWATVTLDGAWTANDVNRFWCVVAPFAAEAKGRIMIGNGTDILKTWQGGGATMAAYPGGFASKFGIMGDDNRLILGGTTEGGTFFGQRVRWTIIALTNGAANDWTDPGSGALDLRNDQWPISGMWKQNGRTFVGKSRAICVLVPTGIATDAYGYETLQTNGEGLYARGSLVQYGNLVGFVTHRDIVIFDGVTLTPILGPNQITLTRRLNYAALDQITSVVDAQNNRVGWGLPLDGATTPTEIWWYELATGHWETDLIPHTALALSTTTSLITIDGLTGTDDALTGTMDQLSGSGAAKPFVIMGQAAGGTFQFDSTSKTDNGNLIPSVYVSPGYVPIGQQIIVNGRPRVIDENDFLVIDEISIRLLDMGDAYGVTVEASGDAGVTWTLVGTVGVAAGGGTFLRPRFVRGFVTGRIPVQDTAQIRLTNITSGARWGWTDVTVFMGILGEKKVQTVYVSPGGPV